MSRLSHINPDQQRKRYDAGYSRLIRRVKLVLPIAAFLLLGLVFGWNQFQTNTIEPIRETYTQEQQSVTRNELINATFESVDEKGQPFTVMAARAVQDAGDENTMLLESPTGRMDLESGDALSVRADQGTYSQDVRTIILNENVKVGHSLGYVLETDILHVDMKSSVAHSDLDVRGYGPEGTIEAKGVQANSTQDIVVFSGPAKLILTNMGGQNIFDFGGRE